MANYVASLIKFCAFATAHVAARRAHSSYRLLCWPARAAGDLIPSTHTSERGGLAGRESDSSYTHFWAGRMAGRRFDSFYTHFWAAARRRRRRCGNGAYHFRPDGEIPRTRVQSCTLRRWLKTLRTFANAPLTSNKVLGRAKNFENFGNF